MGSSPNAAANSAKAVAIEAPNAAEADRANPAAETGQVVAQKVEDDKKDIDETGENRLNVLNEKIQLIENRIKLLNEIILKLPKEFEVSVAKKMAICDCGQSSKLPFCDGTHSKL